MEAADVQYFISLFSFDNKFNSTASCSIIVLETKEKRKEEKRKKENEQLKLA